MMKAPGRETHRHAKPGRKTYLFQLFVAGNESNSAQALGNLVRLCEEHLKGRYEIRIVDVLKNAESAFRNNVIVTPTLVLLKPLPKVTVFGTLRDSQHVMAALRLTGGR